MHALLPTPGSRVCGRFLEPCMLTLHASMCCTLHWWCDMVDGGQLRPPDQGRQEMLSLSCHPAISKVQQAGDADKGGLAWLRRSWRMATCRCQPWSRSRAPTASRRMGIRRGPPRSRSRAPQPCQRHPGASPWCAMLWNTLFPYYIYLALHAAWEDNAMSSNSQRWCYLPLADWHAKHHR